MGKKPEELYNERAKRLEDATRLRVPDRVPVAPLDSGWFVKYGGITWKEAMYDLEKVKAAFKKTVTDLEFDAATFPFVWPGAAFDKLGLKMLRWAGAKLAAQRVDPNIVYQFNEPGTTYEAMPAEDYDWFIDDPSDYIIRRHWPRIMEKLEPFKNLPSITHYATNYGAIPMYFGAFATPEISSAIESLVEAGRESLKWMNFIQSIVGEIVKLGFPLFFLGLAFSPYDYMADYLRGTRGCMIDMYRNPNKLKKAIEKVTPWMINWGVETAKPFSKLTKRVFIPVHKGAGGLMSNEQYKEFWWPSMRELIVGLIDEGLTPYVYTEGIYDDRLEIIKDVPKGKVIYHIESDIFKAKEVLGDTACLVGGPSGPSLNIGSPQEVKDYCKKLIDVVGAGGGFMMGAELPIITAKPENVKAMTEFTKEYGVYKK